MRTKVFLIQIAFLILVICVNGVLVVSAADTSSILGGGITINEILINPIAGETGFDTDQNGSIDSLDEFVELYNRGTSTIDISAWELWDSASSKWFTFPGTPGDDPVLLPPGAYAVVVIGVQPGGSLPSMTNPESLSFDAGQGEAILSNTSDNMVLYDPGENEYIQLTYNGDPVDDPTSTYAGFSATAVRVGQVEDWGNDEAGKSLTRYPSGDTNIVVHDSIPGAGDASPTAIKIDYLNSRGVNNPILRIFTFATPGFIIMLAILAGFLLHAKHFYYAHSRDKL